MKASRGGHGETRTLGAPPEHVQLAQQELAQIYSATEMNEKIMLGKIMEIKGRQLLHTRGQCSAKLEIKANDRRGKELLEQTTGGYTTGPANTTGTAAVETPTQVPPTPPPGTPRTTRSLSPTPSIRSVEPAAEAKAKATPKMRARSTPVPEELDEIAQQIEENPWQMAVEVVED